MSILSNKWPISNEHLHRNYSLKKGSMCSYHYLSISKYHNIDIKDMKKQ